MMLTGETEQLGENSVPMPLLVLTVAIINTDLCYVMTLRVLDS